MFERSRWRHDSGEGHAPATASRVPQAASRRPPPLVSVCIPTYNRAGFIEQSIASVLGQTYHHIEVIVVDNASEDNTAEVVKHIQDRRVRYYRNEKNVGLSGNVNRAFRLAGGAYYIAFEDHDLMHQDLIRQLVELMERHPSTVFAFSGITQIDGTGHPRRTFRAPFREWTKGANFRRKALRRATSYLSMTCLIRASALEKLPKWFNEKDGWYGDLDLWMRLSLLGDVGYIKSPLLYMRAREPGHALTGDEWQNLICIDAIRQRHAHNVTQGWLGRAVYENLYGLSKTFRIMKYRVSRAAQDRKWTDVDSKYTERMLPLPGVIAVACLRLLPGWLAREMRKSYQRWFAGSSGRIT